MQWANTLRGACVACTLEEPVLGCQFSSGHSLLKTLQKNIFFTVVRQKHSATTERENQRLRKKVRRLQDELKRTRSPGAVPVPKRLKVNIGRKVTEETQAEKQEGTIQRDPKWLATSAPQPPQAPYKVQPGSLMVHLDDDVNVRPSQPYLNQQGAPLSSPQQPLHYGSYRPPTPPKPTEFQPLPPFPAPPPLATGPVAPKTYAQPSSVRDGHRAHHVDSMDSTGRQQWRPHPRTRGPSGNDRWRRSGY